MTGPPALCPTRMTGASIASSRSSTRSACAGSVTVAAGTASIPAEGRSTAVAVWPAASRSVVILYQHQGAWNAAWTKTECAGFRTRRTPPARPGRSAAAAAPSAASDAAAPSRWRRVSDGGIGVAYYEGRRAAATRTDRRTASRRGGHADGVEVEAGPAEVAAELHDAGVHQVHHRGHDLCVGRRALGNHVHQIEQRELKCHGPSLPFTVRAFETIEQCAIGGVTLHCVTGCLTLPARAVSPADTACRRSSPSPI